MVKTDRAVPCSCQSDIFNAVPPELRPRFKKRGHLRKVTCPICGLVYWTNRETDICFDCEKKEHVA